jgi:O-antigen ligase
VLIFVFRLHLNWRLLIPMTVLGAALMLMPDLFFQRVQDVAQTRGAGRLDIWTAGIESLQSYGILGAGLENFPNAYTEYAGRERFYQGGHRAPHNIYLSAAVEFGILGIVLLIAAVVSQLRALKASNTVLNMVQVVSFEAACYGILVAGFTLDVLWRKAFWLIWAMSAIAGHCVAENQHQHKTVHLAGSDS